MWVHPTRTAWYPLRMARNFDIAEFRETDDLSPMTTRKLNSNFRRVLDLMLDLELEGVDTASIAEYVLDIVEGDIDNLEAEDVLIWEAIHQLEPGGGAVTGVKGDVEQDYNTGDVSIGLKETGYAMHSSFVSDLWNGTAEPDQDDLPD